MGPLLKFSMVRLSKGGRYEKSFSLKQNRFFVALINDFLTSQCTLNANFKNLQVTLKVLQFQNKVFVDNFARNKKVC
jgi:hypothetical protein